MVGVSDIPDWCYVEAYGTKGKKLFTEAPTAEHLAHLYSKSPISHISKVLEHVQHVCLFSGTKVSPATILKCSCMYMQLIGVLTYLYFMFSKDQIRQVLTHCFNVSTG